MPHAAALGSIGCLHPVSSSNSPRAATRAKEAANASSRRENISRSPMCSSLPLPGMAQPPHFAQAWLHVLIFANRAYRKAQPFVRAALAQEQAVAQNPMTQQRRGAVRPAPDQPISPPDGGSSDSRRRHRGPPRPPSARRCRSRCSAAPSPGRGCQKDRQAAHLASRRGARRSKLARSRCQSCPRRANGRGRIMDATPHLPLSPSWRRSRESRHGRHARPAR